MGSWVTYGLGSERADLPAYVVMKDGVSTAGDEVFQQGMLPGRHQAAVARVEAGKTPFPNLNPRPGLSLDQRRHYLDTLNHSIACTAIGIPRNLISPAASRL